MELKLKLTERLMRTLLVGLVGTLVILSMALLTVAIVTNRWIEWQDNGVELHSGLWKTCRLGSSGYCTTFDKETMPDWLEMCRILILVADIALFSCISYFIVVLLCIRKVHGQMILILICISVGLNFAGTLAYMINRNISFAFKFTFNYSLYLSWASIGVNLLVIFVGIVSVARSNEPQRLKSQITDSPETSRVGKTNFGASMYTSEY